jgi:hypothetical protein
MALLDSTQNRSVEDSLKWTTNPGFGSDETPIWLSRAQIIERKIIRLADGIEKVSACSIAVCIRSYAVPHGEKWGHTQERVSVYPLDQSLAELVNGHDVRTLLNP